MDHTLRAEKLERTTWVLRSTLRKKPRLFLGTEIPLFKPLKKKKKKKSQESSPRQVTGSSSQLGSETRLGEGSLFLFYVHVRTATGQAIKVVLNVLTKFSHLLS